MPIAMSMREWSRIKKWTQPDYEDQETARKRDYVNYLNETSHRMTKDWPNSLENVNKRNEEVRLARIASAEEANTKFYKRYMKRKKEEQEQLMYSARDIVFKNRDAPKLLLSAVIETAIQKERIEQVKFQQKLRQQAKEEKRKVDDDIIRKAKEWHEMKKKQAKLRFEVNKEHQREIVEQANEIAERNRIEHETELNLQKIDNMNAIKEMKTIEEFEKNLQAKEKARILASMHKANQERQARIHEQAARDKMDDRLIDVLNKSRARVERRRKQTEKELKDEKARILEAISARLKSGDEARDAKEQDMLNKANRDKEKADEARRQQDIRKVEAIKKERQDSREKFLRDEEARLHEFNAVRQWEIMNRFKNEELYADYQEKMRQERARKIQDYKEDVVKLWKEREDREARELAEQRYFYGELAQRKIRDADNKVLTYAKHLIDEAKQHDRPVYALRKTVDAYCKMNRLLPMPDLPASMQEHFPRYTPWDGTEPDRDYVEPPPPVATCKDDLAVDVGEKGGKGTKGEMEKEEKKVEAKKVEQKEEGKVALTKEKRSGLQEIPKSGVAGPSKPATAKAEKPSEDYKRAGPANGLQVRNLQTTCELPPIKVELPCCRCPTPAK